MKVLLPGATLGVMGGGQLGRMFVHAAQALGYEVVVLDPDAQAPAGAVAQHQVRSAYTDEAGLAELARRCDAI
ncbi:MAG TPA: NAD(P)-dependent oxidoreductase, partial [Ramlibacter sp.]|nr:NAD(P)-dependent oxidoreductase [Ramlibacter sp.]